MRIRKIRAALVAAGTSIALAACGPASTADGDATFVLYHDFDAEAITPIVAAFKKHYKDMTGEDPEVST